MVAHGTSQAYGNGQGGMNNRRIVEVQQYITDILPLVYRIIVTKFYLRV